MLTQALTQARRWRDDGLVLRVAVKITMQDLARLDFPEFVLDEAARAGTPPSDLVLQVPESRLMQDARVPREVLTRLRLKGVGLAVEGFGAGQASLAQIQDIAFQELRIDRSVVRGARARTTQRAMFWPRSAWRTSSACARSPRTSRAAPTADLVRDAGFDLAQGHFVAMPMPAQDVVPWEHRWRDRVEGVLS